MYSTYNNTSKRTNKKCMELVKKYIVSAYNCENCSNLNEISQKICKKEIKLTNVTTITDNHGNKNAIDKTKSYIHHSER